MEILTTTINDYFISISIRLPDTAYTKILFVFLNEYLFFLNISLKDGIFLDTNLSLAEQNLSKLNKNLRLLL